MNRNYSAAITAVMSFLCLTPLHAQELTDKDAFIQANVFAIFYHELGHAIIDVMDVPIFGQEEDAADVMSVLLIDWLFEEDAAQSIAYDSAFGYINDPDGTEEVAYWDVHGPDEQRYFNHVCLFYGANPDDREDLASDLGLPEERAEYCPEEYDLAADSWGGIFDEMEAQSVGKDIVFVAGDGPEASIVNQTLAEEVELMNADLNLPERIEVRVESCGEANAFYDPNDISITFCTEFIPHLEGLYQDLFTD